MSERLVHTTENALVCQTVQAVFVGEQDLDLQIRIHVEKNEASHHLVDLLKMGIITWKHPSCKLQQSKGVCEGCRKTFATTQGELHMCLGVNGNNKCPDCLQNPQDMEKTCAENETVFTEFCGRSGQVIKEEGHLTNKNKDGDGEVNDKVCKEENDGGNYSMEKETERSVERVEDIHEYTLASEKTVLDSFCMEIKVDRRKLGRKSYVQFECRLCSKMFPSKATIFQHFGEQHKDEVNNLTVMRDSALKEVAGSISGDVEVTENTDHSTGISTVMYRPRNDSNIRPYKCEVCGRTYQLKNTLKRHQRTSHKSSELKELMGSVSGEVNATEITDHSMGRSTVVHEKMGNVNDWEVTENTDQSVDDAVIFVERNQNDRYIRLYKCEVCGISYQLKKTLRRHQRTSHKSSELKELMGNVSGDVNATEITDRSMGRSTVIHEKMGNVNDGEVTENTDQSVGATVVYVKRKRNDSNIRPYKCEVCSRTYQLKKTLKRHQRTSHKSSELKEFMGNVTGDVDATEITDHSMITHEKMRNVNDGEVTENTDENVGDAVIFVERNQNDRYIRPYKCEVCGISYQLQKTLRRHQRTSHKCSELKELMGKVVVAGNTDQDGGATVVYVKRKRNDSNIRPYKCEVCSLTYQSEKTLKRHQRTHHNMGELTELMGNVSGDVDVVENTDKNMGKSKAICVKRIRNVSNIRPYECKVCSNTYQLLKSLKSHERTHQTGKLSCEICGREFHLQSRLTCHLRFHTGERPFKCTICSSSFRNNSNLTRHLKTHDKEPAYTCSKCGKGFTEACYLAVHLRIHSGERPYQCHVCGKCFTNASSVNVHQAMHSDRIYKCEICLKIFKTLRAVRNHKVIHTSTRSNVCELCGLGFITQSRLKQHKKIHNKERPFTCRICLKGFVRKSDLKIHEVSHSDDRPFECDVCDKTFSRKAYLLLHSYVHTSEHPHQCTECGKGFARLHMLQKHSGIHSSNKPFMCELCGKSFRLKSLLRSHFRTHSGYRPHACDICGRKYRSVWYMQVHRKTHTGENLIQCNDCGDWFVNPSYFKLHQRKHCKGGKLIYCSTCNHRFSSNRELEKHMGLHTGERPFGCDICGVAFSKKALLQDHIKRHTQENVHKCGSCGKGFKRTNELRKHEKRHTRMMKMLLQDELKPGHKSNIAALQTDLLQQATEGIEVTESISDANESGIVYVDAAGTVKHLVPLSTIDNGQFQQNQEVVFLESDNRPQVEEKVMVEIDHPYISGAPTVCSIQTSEGMSPSQSFTSTDRIIIQVDHPYISSRTATSDDVHIQTTEACGIFSSADDTELSVAPTIQILPSVLEPEGVALEQGQLQTLTLQSSASSSQAGPADQVNMHPQHMNGFVNKLL